VRSIFSDDALRFIEIFTGLSLWQLGLSNNDGRRSMSIKMLDPVQEPADVRHPLAPRLATLNGKVLGLYNNNKLNAERLLEMISEELAQDYTFVVELGQYNASDLMKDHEWGNVGACDAIILANGDCGACSSSGIANAIALEKRGIPTLLITTPPFVDAVRTMARLSGMQAMGWAVVSHPIGSAKEEELRIKAREAARQFREIIMAEQAAAKTQAA
jgi:hypothetical protein